VRGGKIGVVRKEMKKTDENNFQLIHACGGGNRSRNKRNISYGLERASMFSTKWSKTRAHSVSHIGLGIVDREEGYRVEAVREFTGGEQRHELR
jgi:hypothetical protein